MPKGPAWGPFEVFGCLAEFLRLGTRVTFSKLCRLLSCFERQIMMV